VRDVAGHELLALRGPTEDLARFRPGADEIPSRRSVGYGTVLDVLREDGKQ